MYLAVLFLGYGGYGDYVQHDVVDSMMFPPRSLRVAQHHQKAEDEHSMMQNPIGIIMAVIVPTCLFLGFSLFFECVFGMMRNVLGKSHLYKEGHIAKQILRTIIVAWCQ